MNEEAAQKSDGGEKCNGGSQRRKRPKKVGTIYFGKRDKIAMCKSSKIPIDPFCVDNEILIELDEFDLCIGGDREQLYSDTAFSYIFCIPGGCPSQEAK
ncbi:hypothetical protein DUI87_08645 [Hirundo rustica rustica]|uniref:Uncharacterized protein n=1 Tax=Hirundo rustica rustica TaxID=333673 RepID=A0A3M0KJZ4_HIRRU|nr:hypothetical protein DUI87_08645 [Hirundo rustica rustica]